MLEKIERKEKLIDYFSKYLPDNRDPLRIKHSRYKLLKQGIFMLMQGYQDTNDVFHLQHDPLYKDVLDGDLAFQPTLSRFENRIKEVKNMCFSYRLSNHGFWANFFRLLISSIAYEIFLVIKSKIKKTSLKKLKNGKSAQSEPIFLKLE